MEKGIIPVEDRRIVIKESTYLWLEEKAANERKKIKGNTVMDNLKRSMMTPKSLAQSILATAQQRDGTGGERR